MMGRDGDFESFKVLRLYPSVFPASKCFFTYFGLPLSSLSQNLRSPMPSNSDMMREIPLSPHLAPFSRSFESVRTGSVDAQLFWHRQYSVLTDSSNRTIPLNRMGVLTSQMNCPLHSIRSSHSILHSQDILCSDNTSVSD